LTRMRRRDARTPVLILTAKDTLQDKLEGFRTGTDDYLTKPFAFEELLSRVRVLTRRKYQFFGTLLRVGSIELDSTSRSVSCEGRPLILTSREFAVLELFFLRRSHVLSREKISDHIYSEEAEQGSNVIDVFINKLRRKLESAGAGTLIETVRGEGYVIR